MLQLLNGGNAASPPLGNAADGRYCGNSPPPVMETSSNRLFVNFVSDGFASAVGFKIDYEEVHVSCGGSIRLVDDSSTSTVMSPNYPQNYPHNVDCVWVITAPAGESVQADFDENFNIESHTRYICNYMYD